MDELKRLHYEEYDRLLEDPVAILRPLLEDAEYMLERMQRRLEEYDGYRARIRSALQELDEEAETEAMGPEDALAFLKELVASSDRFARTDIGEIGEAAEAIRAVASAREHRMRANKELALSLNRLFLEINGSRAWILTEEETGSYKEAVRERYQSWLPPEPHRAFLLNRLAESTAEIQDASRPGGEPTVHFDDGGSIAMSQVRWDPAIRNFHPANHKPAPGGRLYRRATP